MFFWYLATSVIAVGWVFRDPRFDYRLLLIGSVFPLVDGFFGGARALYSVVTSVLVLAAVMLATIGRRPLRKLLLGFPIGMILHLVFSGAWGDTAVFWWPLTGWSFDGAPLPEVERGWWSVVLEVVGVAGCVWVWKRNGLSDAERRKRFVQDGQLEVAVRH